MDAAELLLLAIGAVGVAAVARRLGWQAPLLLVVVGFGVSFLPGMPEVEIDGELLLAVVLPPLLYSSALGVSYVGFRALFHPIVQLGVGLVFVTAITVALVARLVVPDLPMPVALVLGAIVAPPDAVSAASIGRQAGAPPAGDDRAVGREPDQRRRGPHLLQGRPRRRPGRRREPAGHRLEHRGRHLRPRRGRRGGDRAGPGLAVHALRMRLDDPVVESVLGLIVPFAAYLLAEELHGSGVLAVVAAGLYLGYRGPEAGYATRLQERPLWSSLDLLLEAVVFALIGLQLRYVAQRGAGVRPVQHLPAGRRGRGAGHHHRGPVRLRLRARAGPPGTPAQPRSGLTRPQRPPWSYQVVISWTGMRGVVTLAAAAALPVEVDGEPFADRGAVQFLAFAVTIGTLLLQGLTLPG